jgi:hypothetical protein
MLSKTFSDALRDKALLIVAALVLATMGFFSFLLADKYHIRPAWVFAFWLSVGFIAVIGKGLRARFRQPLFVLFFAGWLLIHVLVMVAAMSLLTPAFWIPVIAIELFIGYALTFRLFGLPRHLAFCAEAFGSSHQAGCKRTPPNTITGSSEPIA